MTEERITETRTPDGNTHTHTTVISDGEPRSGGGSKWAMVLVVLVLGVLAIWAFTQFGESEAAKDNAIAGAANEVGEAAGQVGDAAQDAADSIGN
jgi:NADPH-dependent curcumin reductase CurA